MKRPHYVGAIIEIFGEGKYLSRLSKILSRNMCSSKSMRVGVADAEGAPTTSYGTVFQSMLAASHCQLCNSPESFLWPWGMVGEHAGQARRTKG